MGIEKFLGEEGKGKGRLPEWAVKLSEELAQTQARKVVYAVTFGELKSREGWPWWLLGVPGVVLALLWL